MSNKKELKKEQVIIRIIPFFIVAIASTGITLSVATEKEVVKTYFGESPYVTLLAMLGVFFDYIKLLFFPINLNARYEVPAQVSFYDLRIISGIVIIIAFIFILFRFRKGNRGLFFCVAWFMITLIPVSNIIPIAILKADRYLYIPSFAFIIGLGLVLAKRKSGHKKTLFLVISLCFFLLTFNRNSIWRNSHSLWQDTIKKSPNDMLVYNNLGTIYVDKGDINKGIFYFKKAIEINHFYSDPHFNLSILYAKNRQYNEALSELKIILSLNQQDFKAYMNLGNIYTKMGINDKAFDAYKKAMDIDRKSGEPHYNLALLLNNMGLVDGAIKEYKIAINLDPTLVMAHNNLGNIYFKKGLIEDAIKEYRTAVNKDSLFYEAYNNLGSILSDAGRNEEAIKFLKIAIALKKGEMAPHFNLGRIYMEKKMFDDAIREFKTVLKIKPDNFQAHINLGMIFYNLGNSEKATEHFNASIKINPKEKTPAEFLEKINLSKKQDDLS